MRRKIEKVGPGRRCSPSCRFPAAHYRVTDPGIHFYAEFLTPLVGDVLETQLQIRSQRAACKFHLRRL
jgi:hypothetical protein